MAGTALDGSTLAIVVLGAFVAGFTTGFAGFGTGLVASGLWLHALPAAMVPPLVALASVAAQLVGLLTIRTSFELPRALPYLLGGAAGVPFGVAALTLASPVLLKASIGAFLIAYASWQLLAPCARQIGSWGGKRADAVVGAGGGFLGGFAGLSGPLPLIWLQMRGGPVDRQRAVYQPFNLAVLALASVGMALTGQISLPVLWIALACLPATLIGAMVGARIYAGVSAEAFRRVLLALLLASGCVLCGQVLVT